MAFTPARLKSRLADLPATSRYCVAYSGGCDSRVLLQALAALRPELDADLRVLHVNHNLHPEAARWAAHCRQSCEALALPCTEVRVAAQPDPGESREAAARAARYRVFEDILAPGEGLLLAHHQDDQAETLLLQLLRGSGPAGLAAMPVHRPLGQGWLGRPLLDFRRAELCAWAQAEGLAWIDDPSNFDTDLDRNYLRHTVLPHLQARWPAAGTTLARAAAHQAEATQLLRELAEQDWQTAASGDPARMPLAALASLDPARQRNLLRYWIGTLNRRPVPDQRRLDALREQMQQAAPDAQPSLHWPGACVRRHGGELYLLEEAAPSSPAPVLSWDLQDVLPLGTDRALQATPIRGAGLRASLAGSDRITVRYRQGGEVCRPAGRGHRHALKKLLQEWGVPPWQRARLPLVFVDDELAAVVGHCVCEPYQAGPDEAGLQLREIAL